MEGKAFSKLWSCSTLEAGMAHVLQASTTLNEEALRLELQDPCKDILMHAEVI